MNTPLPRRRDRRQRRRRAFSLIEVIVAVTIVALLATLVIPRVWDNIGRSKTKIAQAEVNSLANQVRLYMADTDMSRLDPDFDLELLLVGDRPYLNNSNDLLDPWDRPYVVVIPGQNNIDFDIVSYGADGEPGGDGDNSDVVNGG